MRSKKGRIKREMFAKLRTSRFMKAKGSDSAAVVEFAGKVQRMARVHQYGLKDRPNRNSRDVQYDARPLLGFTRDDEQMIEDVIIRHLGKKLLCEPPPEPRELARFQTRGILAL